VAVPQKVEFMEDSGLDPLNLHELMFESKMFLPLSTADTPESSVQPLIFKVSRAKNL
jgi:hypothetical protein